MSALSRASTAPRRPISLTLRYQLDFFVALAIGVATWALTAGQHEALRVLLAADVFFALYAGRMILQARRLDAKALRARGGVSRRSGLLVLALTFAAMLLSLVVIFLLLNHPKAEGPLFPALAVASVPLSWAMIHTHAAVHYAKLYYAAGPDGGVSGGLRFPEGGEPDALDLLYYAFVIGTSASVSDVSITSRPMRVATMLHSIASFTFNAVLIAIAVNAAITFTS